jgi:protein tyrosine phosphatase
MNIYNSPKTVLPYVYRCVEKTTGRFYIGYRFKNTVPANSYVKENFDNFDFEIVAEFPDRKSAFAFETKLIKETKCEKQINANKYNQLKRPYKKSEIHLYCLFPGCGKYINSSIKRFCCRSHAGKYTALLGHGKL